MKILIIVDKKKSAIDRLAEYVKQYSPHLDIKILPVHPKRPDFEQLEMLPKLLEWCDVLDIHYWKSGEMVKSLHPELFAKKKKVLFHMNPYDLDKGNWPEVYDITVVGNTALQGILPYAKMIPYGIDLDFYTYNDKYDSFEMPIVNMVAGRIEAKKGPLQVAEACKELGYKLHLIGRISDSEYFQKIMATGVVQFFEDVTDEELREHYYSSMIHVCNSVDNFESGTMPILESMACGLPVLTRNVGHVPDLYNGENMLVRKGDQDDMEDLKTSLKNLMENKEYRIKLREKAWETIKSRDVRVMASRVRKLYQKLYLPETDLVSIVIPTRNRHETLSTVLRAAASQTHQKIEIIVADSSDVELPADTVSSIRDILGIPFKYVHFPYRGYYNLAEARNRAIIESEGEFIVFCDDRLEMEEGAVKSFVEHTGPRMWTWGMKDSSGKSFVENFSCVHRVDLIACGMFNERICFYGGMTQEVRSRFERLQQFSFQFVDSAKANSILRARGKNSKRKEIIEAKHIVYKLYGDKTDEEA